jgi:tRNA pseudouridine38-40 synthase
MNEAAKILFEVDDFTSFAKLHADNKTNICRVTEARWEPLGDGRWVFVITADRFLRNMVRAVVGTLVEVGRGKITIDDFRRIIEKKDRCSAGTSMPAHALFLWEVKYPYYQP